MMNKRFQTEKNASVVDKLPSASKIMMFNKDKGDIASMTTDQARKGEDETSYTLDQKSTIEEFDESSHSNDKTEYLSSHEKEVMSMSANSSANFSFATHDTKSSDAYPALYNPDIQAQYEKMKIEEEERKERLNKWGPFMIVIESIKNGMQKIFSTIETMCLHGMKKQS